MTRPLATPTSRRWAAPLALLAALAWATPALAGTTGKISGRVVDPKGQPLTGANVIVPEARKGAATDADGYYNILDVPPGTYVVKVSLIGYQTVTIEDVSVSSDVTTRLDATLHEAAVQLQEIVVKAGRPVVQTNLTSTRAILDKGQINELPVQELQDVVNLQAGVVDGHFRGGRSGEVQYQVNGLTVNNPYDNTPSVRLDRSLLEEVQVISGSFDAEYGQAMSGVVNAVLRTGTDRYEWHAEALGGDYFYPDDHARPVSWEAHPGSIQNYQADLSGPVPGAHRTYFLVSGHRRVFDDPLWGERLYLPTDRNGIPTGGAERTLLGSGREWSGLARVPLGYERERSGLAKITNRAFESTDVSYQVLVNDLRGRRADNAFRFLPDGLSKQHTVSVVHGLDLTHRFSKNAFLDASFRQNYFDYHDRVYDDAFDAAYDSAGSVQSFPASNPASYNTQGVQFTRFVQRTNSFVYKLALSSQVTRDHLVKVGWESQFPVLDFGTPVHLIYLQEGGQNALFRKIAQPPNYPGVQRYRPVQWAAYAQDAMEWNDVTVRGGLRLDYFQARAYVPSDPANPANAIAGAPASVPRPTTRKLSLSPRLGVSYPVGPQSAVFFAYGHFSQLPALGDMFSNADYSVLADLQAGTARYGVLGNPDVGPERTVQYEFGFKQAIRKDLGLDVTAFYKDIRDLLGVEIVSTYSAAEYARFTNVDFGNVIGFTISLDQRPIGWFSASLDYTWQKAQGNSSDPRETANRAAAGEDPRPRQIAFDWDQRHTLNLTLTLAEPRAFDISAIVRAASGQPYTPQLSTIFGTGPETNSGRKPNAFRLDLKAQNTVRSSGPPFTLFVNVYNVFDTRFFNGFVFADTGSPDYARVPSAFIPQLSDPDRFYPPRRIELGLSLGSGL